MHANGRFIHGGAQRAQIHGIDWGYGTQTLIYHKFNLKNENHY